MPGSADLTAASGCERSLGKHTISHIMQADGDKKNCYIFVNHMRTSVKEGLSNFASWYGMAGARKVFGFVK